MGPRFASIVPWVWTVVLAACGAAPVAPPLPLAPAEDASAEAAEEVVARVDPRALIEDALFRMSRGENVVGEVRGLPEAASLLVAIASDAASPLRREAVALLGDVQSPDAVGLLSELVDDAGAGEALRLAATLSLARYDSALPAFVLLRARTALVAGKGDPAAIDALNGYFWRLGLTDELGMCGVQGPTVAGRPGRPLGTAHPVRAYAADAGQRWAVLCQARGDSGAFAPYLVIVSGEGQPVDDVLGQDPTGRYLVVRRGMCVVLVDAAKRTEAPLRDADVRDPDRVVSFSSDGAEVLYLRGSRVVARDLATGAEGFRDTAIAAAPHERACSGGYPPVGPELVGARGASAWGDVVPGPVRWKNRRKVK